MIFDRQANLKYKYGSGIFCAEEIRRAVFPVNVVDTTAAGDAIMGNFAGCLAQGYPPPKVVLLA